MATDSAPRDCSLQVIRDLIDAALRDLSREFSRICARHDRPSIPPGWLSRYRPGGGPRFVGPAMAAQGHAGTKPLRHVNRSEPHTLALSRCLAHGNKPVRRGFPALCPGRGRLAAVPLGRGPSLHGLRKGRALIVRPLHRYYSLVRLLIPVHAHRSAAACMSRSGMPVRTRMRSPRFRAKDVSTCMGSPTARGSFSQSHLREEDVAFRPTERRQHLGIRPVSQLNTQPMVSPVNASS